MQQWNTTNNENIKILYLYCKNIKIWKYKNTKIQKDENIYKYKDRKIKKY